jgi:hypothetical protein
MDTSLQLANFVTVQVKARRKATKTRVYLENAKYMSSLLPFFAQLGRNKKVVGPTDFGSLFSLSLMCKTGELLISSCLSRPYFSLSIILLFQSHH